MPLCYVVDQLLDEHGLADSGAAEEADLAALQIGFQQVDDLDSGIKHLLGGGQVFELGGLAVDGQGVVGLESAEAVDRIACDVHHSSADLCTDGHLDGGARERDFEAPAESVGRVHGHAAHGVFAYVLLDLKHQLLAVGADDLEGVVY